MSDELSGPGTPPNPDENALEAAKLTRLPRRPRRLPEDPDGPPRKTWHASGDSPYEPAPTRPVLRSELQRETGWWPVDPGPARPTTPPQDPTQPARDATIFDLDALRRRRAGDTSPTVGIRRIAKPRRITPGTAQTPTDPDTSPPQDPTRPS